MRKVFLSSTSRDLKKYRKALTGAIHRLDGYHCVRMEDFGARDWNADYFCRMRVKECDLFICIAGHLYGSCPVGSERSYTEREFDTAVETGKPRLIFIAPDDFPLPYHLREPDESHSRQQAFRQKAGADRIRDTFTSPEDLAKKVVAAISNWEREGRQPAPTPQSQNWEPPSRVTYSSPDLGDLVIKLCNRTEQEERFLEFFSEHIKPLPGRQHFFPHLYFIHGEERQRPESLIERFSKTRIQDYAHYKWGPGRGVISELPVEWANSERRLVRNLFESHDPHYGFRSANPDFSPGAFARLNFSELGFGPVILLNHTIRAKRWDAATKDLIGWYAQFWDKVAIHAPPPQFLIFVTVIHAPGFWESLARLSKGVRRRIERELDEICAKRQTLSDRPADDRICPALLLDELPRIAREHVMDWFGRHKIYANDAKIQQLECDRIFKWSFFKRRHMLDVEHELGRIHSEFIELKKERGSYDRRQQIPSLRGRR